MKGSIIALIGALVIGGAGGFMVGKKATSGTEDELVGDAAVCSPNECINTFLFILHTRDE